jgi:surface protein
MFSGATSFNQPLSSWNLSNVLYMNEMFYNAQSFNKPIGSWSTDAVTYMSGMFKGAIAFNQNIGSWDVSNVQTMREMFKGASSFNQNISLWDVTNVANMSSMFEKATSFDQNIGSWNVGNVEDMYLMFKDISLSTENYDNILSGWASLDSLQNNVIFTAGDSFYCESINFKNSIIDLYSWSITDNGFDPICAEPNISISVNSDFETVDQSIITLSVSIDNFIVGQSSDENSQGHWHYTIDDEDSSSMVYNENDIVLENLDVGQHTIHAWLVDNNHQQLDPVVETFTTFNIGNNGNLDLSCSFTIHMMDSYGDGWQGNYLNIYVNVILNNKLVQNSLMVIILNRI